MKPSWKYAPNGYKYRACDSNGQWFFFKHKPEASVCGWIGYDKLTPEIENKKWRNSLEERPVKKAMKR